MPLSLAAALALASQCAPTVAPETLLSVVQVESRFDPFAIGVNGARRAILTPASVTDAIAKAEALIAAGRNIDLGLAQINSRNLAWLGLTIPQAFEPCANFAAAARILQAGYVRSDAAGVGEQVALRRALSFYNTGHPRRGFANGYVAKVSAAAARVVPALHAAGAEAATDGVAEGSRSASPTWDVFGEAGSRPASFVITVSTAASGGPQ